MSGEAVGNQRISKPNISKFVTNAVPILAYSLFLRQSGVVDV